MGIRVATAPVSWGIMEVEGWGWQQSFGEVLDEMVAAGYAGTELGPWGFLPTEPALLKRELAARGLALVGAFVPIALENSACYDAGLQTVTDTAKLLAACGARVIVLADAMYERRMAVAGRVDPERDGLSRRQWEEAAALVERAARTANQFGLEAVFHHHAGTYIETPAEIDRLMEMTDPPLLGLCLDTGHYCYGGGDPVEAAERHATRIWHLHLKDIRGPVLEKVRREKIGFLDAVRGGVFCELGQGQVNLRGVIEKLSGAGFDGWAVFEQDVDPAAPGVQPAKSAARSRAWLREQAGL